ncbi:MAG: zeta toxin family protein [Comamonadaceae bacterium]|nr:zeta toxin family protein [Comamonadaceae bacterium]
MSNKAAHADPAAKTTNPAPAQLAQPRLRVLAGPNGSGKSTIKPELKPQWIGAFVNADEIEKALRVSGGFLNLRELRVTGEPVEVLSRIKNILQTFGLDKRLNMDALLPGITLDKELTLWLPGPYHSYLAASLAEAVRQELLHEGKTFTFETVMSHRSKIDFMRKARAHGYRIYLYFMATDDPAINIDRVHRRVLQGGHSVPDDKVKDRYYKSIGLMTEACEVAHRAYIFDNSGARHKLLAEVTDYDTIRLESSVINPWLLGTDLWKTFS